MNPLFWRFWLLASSPPRILPVAASFLPTTGRRGAHPATLHGHGRGVLLLRLPSSRLLLGAAPRSRVAWTGDPAPPAWTRPTRAPSLLDLDLDSPRLFSSSPWSAIEGSHVFQWRLEAYNSTLT